MDANGFIATLKATGTDKDETDLKKMLTDYKTILAKLPKDKGVFALNALCVLCRNLDKVPKWRDSIDNKDLLLLGIECVRGTRGSERGDRVKTLACVFHIHKHIVRQDSPIPPELVLKFSYMPFEYDDQLLLTEYCKTYWSILADRLTYIERLKAHKMNVAKLLPKFIEDLLKVIRMYETVPFCASLLVFIVKKLHMVFNESPKEVGVSFVQVFDCIARKNLEVFKGLKEKDVLDLFVKFNECLVVVAEVSLRTYCNDVFLDDIVRSCITVLGHHSAVFHSFQTFYLNGFCCVFNEKSQSPGFKETILQNLLTSCDSAEMGYKTVMNVTYPFINQFLRLYIEYKTQGSRVKNFSDGSQVSCLKFMVFIMKKLRKTDQLLKCENCSVRSGLHDALRLSFLAKNFVCNNGNLKTILPVYYNVIETQYAVLYELKKLACANYLKCFRKLQTDIHNTAISLNKAQFYELSIKIFDVYLINEVKNSETEADLKNLSRGLYNKSICELDCKTYEIALKDAYLSLVLGCPEPSTEKYMSLVMDIKAKMLKSSQESDGSDEEKQDYFQMLSVLDACKLILKDNAYGNLRPLLQKSKFSVLLQHEFSMYAKLWPSILPIAGVWSSLNSLVKGAHEDWLPVAEQKDDILKILYSIVLETPSVVRTIHSDYYKVVIAELIQDLEDKSGRTLEDDIVFATLLFLQSEYDVTEASQKYGWKSTEHTIDPDQGEAIRTFPQEHDAVRRAKRAVDIWTRIIGDVKTATPLLPNALRIAEVFVHQFLHMRCMVHALQLACICCKLALCVGDKESYICNASVIIGHAERQNKSMDYLVATTTKFLGEIMRSNLEIALCYLCELSIYYNKLGYIGASGKLVRFVQARILQTCEKSNVNLDLAVGRLMEAQYELFGFKHSGQTVLSMVNNIQRHYVAICNNATTFTGRRRKALILKHRSATSAVRAARAACQLRLYRRGRAAAAAGLPRAAASDQAMLYGHITNVCNVEDTQIKIDNRLKHILGLQPTNETQPSCLAVRSNIKHETFTPKQGNIETMLDSMTFKKTQTSPSLPCITIPAFKTPDFFDHTPNCVCYACDTLYTGVIACYACGLEAAMYFRGSEFDIARNYFDGASRMFEAVLNRFRRKIEGYRAMRFDENVLGIVSSAYRNELRELEVDFLVQGAFFELAQGFYDNADDKAIRIHEIMAEMRTVDPYLKSEVLNLLVTSASLRKVVKTQEVSLETEFEALKLSPETVTEVPKTPVSKYVPQAKAVPKIVKDEELPNTKRKVIKLNLDEASSDDLEAAKPVKTEKKSQFKIPIPVHSRPALENITPKPARSKPQILLTQATMDIENTPQATEFFTPQSTPNKDMFFTPMTSIKTYSKRSNIVKNLEAEFSTPKTEDRSVRKDGRETRTRKKVDATEKVATQKDSTKKLDVVKNVCNMGTEKGDSTKKVDNTRKVDSTKKVDSSKKVETGSVKSLREKRTLKRATSPGKLVKEEKVTRSRRKPLDDSSKK